MQKKVLVLKFGTASITTKTGEPDENIIEKIAFEVSQLTEKYNIVIVSSGTVGAGKGFIEKYKGNPKQRKAAAAIGNPLLISLYRSKFSRYGIPVAQSLCERKHFGDREQFVLLKETYQELWKNGVIPIANENDVVSNRNLKFSDNDELATMIAAGFGAKTLMICTGSGGLMDSDKELISSVKIVDDKIMGLVDDSLSPDGGLGGMASKLTFTRMATQMGIKVIIFGISRNEGILSAINGNTGTTFIAKKVKASERKKWLVSGSISKAQIMIDNGAKKALAIRNSLLAVGVQEISGKFKEGDFVEIVDLKSKVLGVAQTKIDSKDFTPDENLIVAHADNIALI